MPIRQIGAFDRTSRTPRRSQCLQTTTSEGGGRGYQCVRQPEQSSVQIGATRCPGRRLAPVARRYRVRGRACRRTSRNHSARHIRLTTLLERHARRAHQCLIDTWGGCCDRFVASGVPAGRLAKCLPPPGWLSIEVFAGRCPCWGVARKRREHDRPESGVPTSVPPLRGKALL